MIIYNDDELCIICVVNYNTHARIVSIYGYIIRVYREHFASRKFLGHRVYNNIMYCRYIPRLRRSLQ